MRSLVTPLDWIEFWLVWDIYVSTWAYYDVEDEHAQRYVEGR